MRVVKPVVFNSATHLVSSTATESVALWSSSTTYALNATARYGDSIYQSLVANNLNKQPNISSIEWVQISPTNRTAMFDSEISTVTTATNTLTVVLNTGYINSIGMFGLVGDQVTITMTDGAGGPTVYTKTISLDGTVISDWYQYFYEPTLQLSELVVTDVPPYLNAMVTVTITGTSTVKVGILSFGTSYDLGDTQFDPQLGIIDYSKKETNINTGVTTFVKRNFSKRLSANVMLDNGQINKVVSVLSDLRATPCIWIPTDSSTYSALLIYGFYKDFSVSIPYPSKSLCSLEIEGLT